MFWLSLSFIALLLASVVALFAPARVGFFLKSPTRAKVFGVYFGAAIICFAIFAVLDRQPNLIQAPAESNATAQAEAVTPQAVQPPAVEVHEASATTTQLSPDEQVKALKRDFKDLYNELQSFRHAESFHTYGFSQEPYKTWMRRAFDSGDKYPGPIQLRAGLLLGDLRLLAHEYMRSQGRSTQDTIRIEQDIKQGLR